MLDIFKVLPNKGLDVMPTQRSKGGNTNGKENGNNPLSTMQR